MKLDTVRNPREFWAGVIYVTIGVCAIMIGLDYDMGSATKMGPAFFPTMLGALLAAIGTIALVRALLVPGPPIGAIPYKAMAAVLAAIVLFGALARGAGLVAAILVTVLVSARASPRIRWPQALALGGGLAVFCTLVFVKGLGIPLPILGAWFGG